MVSLLTPRDGQQRLTTTFKRLRHSYGYTQQQLAQKSAVALATLRKFERTGLISLTSFIKLAFVLGKLDALVDIIEGPPSYKSLDELIEKS